MFQNCKNSRKQGDIGLAVAINYFATKGYTVSIPLTDSQDYDLIVDNDERLFRIQVKTTSYKRNENYFVSLTTKGGNRTGTGKIKKLDYDRIDGVFISTDNGTSYLIPTVDILNKSGLSLGRPYDKYVVVGQVVSPLLCKSNAQ